MEKSTYTNSLESRPLREIKDPKILAFLVKIQSDLSNADSDDDLANLIEMATATLQSFSDGWNAEEIMGAIIVIGKSALAAYTRIGVENLAGILRDGMPEIMEGLSTEEFEN